MKVVLLAAILAATPDLSLSYGLGGPSDRVAFDLDGAARTEGQGGLLSALDVAAVYPVGLSVEGGGHLEARSHLQLGLHMGEGRWSLGLVQDALWRYPVAGAFSLAAGLSTGLRFDLSAVEYSVWSLGPTLGARWGPVEVFYRPRLELGLTSRDAEVLGGRREDGAGLGFVPLWVTAGWLFDL